MAISPKEVVMGGAPVAAADLEMGAPLATSSCSAAVRCDAAGAPLVPLRVVTWNILAPLWVEAAMYPCIPGSVYCPEARRKVLQRRLHELNADVVLLNEVQKRELAALLGEGEAPLQGTFDWHFFPYPMRMWAQLHKPPAEWGLAVIWRRGFLSNTVCSSYEISPTAPPIGFLRGTVAAWGEEVLFVTAHLDGDACPPAVTRSQAQLAQVAEAVAANSKNCLGAVWGGDCNLTPEAPAFKRLASMGHRVASRHCREPTIMSVAASSRLDHLFTVGRLSSESTEIPVCPKGSCCTIVPGMHLMQVMLDWLGCSSPRVPGAWRRLLGALVCLPFAAAAVCCFALPLPCSIRRCRWALEEWGSDHLPVTVTLRCTPTGM